MSAHSDEDEPVMEIAEPETETPETEEETKQKEEAEAQQQTTSHMVVDKTTTDKIAEGTAAVSNVSIVNAPSSENVTTQPHGGSSAESVPVLVPPPNEEIIANHVANSEWSRQPEGEVHVSKRAGKTKAKLARSKSAPYVKPPQEKKPRKNSATLNKEPKEPTRRRYSTASNPTKGRSRKKSTDDASGAGDATSLPDSISETTRRQNANANEKRRVERINRGFQDLKTCVPQSRFREENPSKATILHTCGQYVVELQNRFLNLELENNQLRKDLRLEPVLTAKTLLPNPDDLDVPVVVDPYSQEIGVAERLTNLASGANCVPAPSVAAAYGTNGSTTYQYSNHQPIETAPALGNKAVPEKETPLDSSQPTNPVYANEANDGGQPNQPDKRMIFDLFLEAELLKRKTDNKKDASAKPSAKTDVPVDALPASKNISSKEISQTEATPV
eukprot:Nk52_evm33s32 gene=Nk52_evmTU33s32